MPKGIRSQKIAFCFLVLAVSLEVWALFDLWTGLGGALNEATRFWVLSASATTLSVSVMIYVYSLRARRSVLTNRCPTTAFTIGVVSSILLYFLGISPPFSVSRPDLVDWLEAHSGEANSSVLYSDPDGIRIGACEFIRITRLPSGAILFEESLPTNTPYGSGLVFGDPSDALHRRFQSYSVEPLGDGWFKYRGSL